MGKIVKTPLFLLGQVVGTPGTLAALEKAEQGPQEFLERHSHGEWGDLDEQDRKYASAEEFIVRVQQESDVVYRLRDFTVQEDSLDAPRYIEDSHVPSRTLAPGHKSQSEHDWAYAKRALARGDGPELVIQRIADFRADSKHDPEYYARHTVLKAQASLRSPGPPRPENRHTDRGPQH